MSAGDTDGTDGSADPARVLDAGTLGRWLSERLPGSPPVQVGATEPPLSGYSAETTVFTAHVGGDARRFVLRIETPEPAVYPVQNAELDVEVVIQYRAMDAVARHSSVPIAPLVGYEDDPGVLGAPFFVMGHVEGQVPVESPIYTSEGFFADATPDQRHTLLADGLRTMAELHRIDWRAAGLDWLVPDGVTPGTAHQLALWHDYARRELGDRHHPLLETAFDWLHGHEPGPRELALSWGDPRPGNIIWRDFRCVCVTDFEAVSIAPPEHDLGWWLMFDRWSHETMGVERLAGEPTRDEQATIYAEALGRPVGDTHFDEVFAATRYTAIVVRVMNRLVDRGQLGADNTIWLDNPAVTCLEQLLDQ